MMKETIFIHIDKKVKDDFGKVSSIVKKSNVQFIKRIKVTWGGYSQIQCELNLLKEAVKKTL